jgi:phosphoserine phosphatase RsbX
MPRHEFALGTAADRKLEWGVAAAPLPGESTSGDVHVVCEFAGGVLVAVIDALGHGVDASRAARLAADTLVQYASEDPLELLQRCNRTLRGTRGVVMSLASIKWRENAMTWIGVGDVAGVLLLAQRPTGPAQFETALLTRGGIVGTSDEPTARPWVIPLSKGDTLIFATDGVRPEFTSRGSTVGAPQRMADELLAAFRKETDDALVLVARYPGESEGR